MDTSAGQQELKKEISDIKAIHSEFEETTTDS
jgi:hypothetical protein